MGEKNSKGDDEKKTNDRQNKMNDVDGAKKGDGVVTVVLKMDLHCIGCVSKLRKILVGSYPGIESVKPDFESNKLTVIGRVDPAELRKFLEHKTKKKVELVSPSPKKETDSDKDKEGGGGGEKKSEGKIEKKADDNKKAKEPPVTTAVLKLNLYCEGCIEKICKYVRKTEGCHEIKIDRDKDLVTVKGTMDMKALAESLKEKLKRPVDIVPPKKEGGEKKEKGGTGEEKGKSGGEEGKALAGEVGGDGVPKVEENRMQSYPMGYGYPPVAMYGYPPEAAGGQPGWGYPNPPGFEFSDENPNACSVM